MLLSSIQKWAVFLEIMRKNLISATNYIFARVKKRFSIILFVCLLVCEMEGVGVDFSLLLKEEV